MTAILAMFLDSYRELNSKKLFWVTLIISLLVVLSYGSIGFNPNGISMLYGLWNIDSEFLKEGSPWARTLYLGIFSDFILAIWLAWIATILALISTTGIFPDFLAGGAIDVVLSKPISRIKLFLVKYLTSLLFVFAQVSIFCVGVFLCVGLRLGEWKPLIFAAIPLVTVFFSYLYCINVLVGVITRSAIAALLLTLLFWVSLWSIQSTEGILNQFKTRFDIQVESSQKELDDMKAQLDALPPPADPADPPNPRAERLRTQITQFEKDRADLQSTYDKLDAWHTPIRGAMTVLPKTAETIGLLSRWFQGESEYSILRMMQGDMRPQGEGPPHDENRETDAEMLNRIDADYKSRSSFFIIGTSLAFELVVLAIACWLFVRRDF